MLNSIHSIHMFQLAIVVVVAVYSFIWTFFSYDGVINGVVFTVTVQYIPTYSNTWQSQMELKKKLFKCNHYTHTHHFITFAMKLNQCSITISNK